MKKKNIFYVIQTSEELYVVEDEIYEGKVLEGVFELATRFETLDQAQDFLLAMGKTKISGEIKEFTFSDSIT